MILDKALFSVFTKYASTVAFLCAVKIWQVSISIFNSIFRYLSKNCNMFVYIFEQMSLNRTLPILSIVNKFFAYKRMNITQHKTNF